MQELTFKNQFKSFFLLILGVAASLGATLLNINAVDIPVPVYIMGLLAGFLLCGFVFYSRATTGQTLQITITGVLLNTFILIATFYANDYLLITEITLKPDFILFINPAVIGVCFIFSLLALNLMVKIKSVKKTAQSAPIIKENNEQQKSDVPTDIKNSDKENCSLEMETVSFNLPGKSSEQNLKLEENKPENENKSLYEQLYSQPAEKFDTKTEQEEVFFEDLNENELKEDHLMQGELGLNEEAMELSQDMQLSEENSDVPKDKPEMLKNKDFIPTNIRLTEAVVERNTESKGKIGAIGKLLVSNRDVENIIESNAQLEENLMNSRTNIISNISGEQIYEKFKEIKENFSCIKEMALIDNGGFTLANNYEDKQKAQITGALVSGVYHTLENYLAQLSLSYPIRIFFETANTNNIILRTKNEVLFSIWDKEFKHIEYGPLGEIVELEDFSQIDITPYADIIKIENFTVCNNQGQLINSLKDDESSQQFAAVSSAIFENLKVFFMNLQLINLSKIVIFCSNKVVTIIKAQDKIASFITDAEELPKITEDLLKMEEIC